MGIREFFGLDPSRQFGHQEFLDSQLFLYVRQQNMLSFSYCAAFGMELILLLGQKWLIRAEGVYSPSLFVFSVVVCAGVDDTKVKSNQVPDWCSLRPVFK
jgi:hypothetical protein